MSRFLRLKVEVVSYTIIRRIAVGEGGFLFRRSSSRSELIINRALFQSKAPGQSLGSICLWIMFGGYKLCLFILLGFFVYTLPLFIFQRRLFLILSLTGRNRFDGTDGYVASIEESHAVGITRVVEEWCCLVDTDTHGVEFCVRDGKTVAGDPTEQPEMMDVVANFWEYGDRGGGDRTS